MKFAGFSFKFSGLHIFVWLFFYIVFSFVKINFDVQQWAEKTRFDYVYLCCSVSLIVGFFQAFNYYNGKTEKP